MSVLEHKDNYVTRFVSRYAFQIDITVVMCQIKDHINVLYKSYINYNSNFSSTKKADYHKCSVLCDTGITARKRFGRDEHSDFK